MSYCGHRKATRDASAYAAGGPVLSSQPCEKRVWIVEEIGAKHQVHSGPIPCLTPVGPAQEREGKGSKRWTIPGFVHQNGRELEYIVVGIKDRQDKGVR